MNEENLRYSIINLNLTENHKLLYFNIPKNVIQELELTHKDQLEFDVYADCFFIRKKGSQSLPETTDANIFNGLLVERTITRNNTILRSNLPKEVAKPLTITKKDKLEITIDRKVLIGRKKIQ